MCHNSITNILSSYFFIVFRIGKCSYKRYDRHDKRYETHDKRYAHNKRYEKARQTIRKHDIRYETHDKRNETRYKQNERLVLEFSQETLK